MNQMQYLNLTNALLALCALALGFFLGSLLGNTIGLPWPYDVIAGYVLGLLAGVFVSFELLRKWHTPARTKIITAVILIAVIGIVNEQLQQLAYQVTVTNIILREKQLN